MWREQSFNSFVSISIKHFWRRNFVVFRSPCLSLPLSLFLTGYSNTSRSSPDDLIVRSKAAATNCRRRAEPSRVEPVRRIKSDCSLLLLFLLLLMILEYFGRRQRDKETHQRDTCVHVRLAKQRLLRLLFRLFNFRG